MRTTGRQAMIPGKEARSLCTGSPAWLPPTMPSRCNLPSFMKMGMLSTLPSLRHMACALQLIMKDLEADLRKVMAPNTGASLRESKRNVLKDFVHIAGPLGVTHFLILTATQNASYLRIAKTPRVRIQTCSDTFKGIDHA